MKKIVVMLFLACTIAACSIDDGEELNFEFVKIESVNLPDTLRFGTAYTFEVAYNRPTDCHFFSNFEYARRGNVREVGVINGFQSSASCEDTPEEIGRANLNFIVERNDFYIFRFLQNVSEDGTTEFLEIEVPVAPQRN